LENVKLINYHKIRIILNKFDSLNGTEIYIKE